jgi:hypothetical protein
MHLCAFAFKLVKSCNACCIECLIHDSVETMSVRVGRDT